MADWLLECLLIHACRYEVRDSAKSDRAALLMVVGHQDTELVFPDSLLQEQMVHEQGSIEVSLQLCPQIFNTLHASWKAKKPLKHDLVNFGSMFGLNR